MTKCSADPLSVVALPNNQLSGFGYDAAGNLTSNGGASYSYNGESQLSSTAGVTYTYDGDGNRVKKSNGTEYWGAGPLLESGSGNLQREFIFAGGRRIARRDIASGTVYYYFTDLLGSSDVVTTSSGAIQNESDYFPYGGERVYSQAVTNQNYKFTGKERDGESGLDNFGARYDSSNLGRFMTPDWAARPTAVPYAVFGDPQSLNLYTYVRNDPVSRADADGHDPQSGVKASQTAARCKGDISNTCNDNPDGSPNGSPPAPNQNASAVPLVLPAAPTLDIGKIVTTAVDAVAGAVTSTTVAVAGALAYLVSPGTTNVCTCSTDQPQVKTSASNTNPYAGPVSNPVTVVDPKGNAVPVGRGEQLQGSKDGRWTQVKDAKGDPTGTRIDGGHPASTHPDPRSQVPHAHVPGRTNPDGTPWLPVNQ